MEPILIQINWIYFLGIIGSLILISWYSSGRFTAIETSITWIKEGIIKLEGRIGNLEGRLDKSFSTQSPISLLQRGKDILQHSGLKIYIDNNEQMLLERCKSEKSMSNPYDIQESAFKFFDEIVFPVNLEDRIKSTAFNFGASLEVVRRIGAIYFRDLCLSKLGFKPEDLDKPKH